MKYSDNYIFYPDNRALERAIVTSLGLLSEEVAALATPDTTVTVADNFVHTRGNFEQQHFSSNILEPVREVLEGLLSSPAWLRAGDWASGARRESPRSSRQPLRCSSRTHRTRGITPSCRSSAPWRS